VQIKDNKLYVTPPEHVFQSRERTILHQLVHVSLKYVLPDIDVMLVTSDFCPSKDVPHRSFDGNYQRCSHLVRIRDPLKEHTCMFMHIIRQRHLEQVLVTYL